MAHKYPEELLPTSVKLPLSLVNEIRATVGFQGVSDFIRQAAKERLERLENGESPTRRSERELEFNICRTGG